jgi:hypothetical protein
MLFALRQYYRYEYDYGIAEQIRQNYSCKCNYGIVIIIQYKCMMCVCMCACIAQQRLLALAPYYLVQFLQPEASCSLYLDITFITAIMTVLARFYLPD